MVVVIAELQAGAAAQLAGAVEAVGAALPAVEVAPLCLVDPGNDQVAMPEGEGRVDDAFAFRPQQAVVRMGRRRRQPHAVEQGADGLRGLVEVAGELHLAVAQGRDAPQRAAKVALQLVAHGVELHARVGDAWAVRGPGGRGCSRQQAFQDEAPVQAHAGTR